MKEVIITMCLLAAISTANAGAELGFYKSTPCDASGTVVKTSYWTNNGKKYLQVHVNLTKSGKMFESTVDFNGVRPEDFPKGSYFCAIDYMDH